MAETQQGPPGVDTSKPSVARIYDYLLGGVNNFPVDQAAAELMKSRAPELVDGAFANRGFHQRAAKWIAEQGVRQFIDLGSGLPTVGNTHVVVRKVHPDAHVVYVDNDPMVQVYGSQLLAGDDAAAVVLADLRYPDSVLGSEAVRRLIDFREPAALMLTAVRQAGVPRAAITFEPVIRYARWSAPWTWSPRTRVPGPRSPGWGCGAATTLSWLTPRDRAGCTAPWLGRPADWS